LRRRIEGELEGARNRGAVEQGVNCSALGVGRRGLDPELAEDRKLLGIPACVDGQPARRKAIMLPAAEKAEVARAEEGDGLVEHLRLVEWIVQAETREARVHRQRLVELGAAVVEHLGREGYRSRH